MRHKFLFQPSCSNGRASSDFFRLGYVHPREMTAPCETSNFKVLRVNMRIFKCFFTDNINDGDQDRGPRFFDTLKQRFQPEIQKSVIPKNSRLQKGTIAQQLRNVSQGKSWRQLWRLWHQLNGLESDPNAQADVRVWLGQWADVFLCNIPASRAAPLQKLIWNIILT